MTNDERIEQGLLGAAALAWAEIVGDHPLVATMDAAQAFEIGFLKGIAMLKRAQEKRASRDKFSAQPQDSIERK